MGLSMAQLTETAEGRSGEDPQYWLDSTRIKEELGWEAEISLEEGVKDMIAWGRKYLEIVRNDTTEFTLHA